MNLSVMQEPMLCLALSCKKGAEHPVAVQQASITDADQIALFAIDQHRCEKLNLAEYQRAVGSTETEVVVHCDIYLHVACDIRTVVQVTIRVLLENIDGRG